MTGRHLQMYQRLLAAYPSSFRSRFGQSMCDAFSAELEEAQARGPGSVVRLWIVSVMHIGALAAVEWARLLVGRGRPSLAPQGEHRRETVAGGIGRDIAASLRALRRQPGYTALVIGTLALGIGANTAIFSLVNGMLFAPLPFGDADRLVQPADVVARPGEAEWRYTPSAKSFYAQREGFPLFESMAGHEYRRFSITGTAEPMQVVGVAVTDRWLETLQIQPVVGRGFTPDEERLVDDARVALISYAVFTQRFGGDEDILERPILLDGVPHEIIGVMPPGFNYPWTAELWTLGRFDVNDASHNLGAVARVAPGVTFDRIEASLAEFSATVARQFPDTHRDIRFSTTPIREYLVGNYSGVGLALLGAVGLLLIIACANVAGVSVVRVLGRSHELALRAALGSSRWKNFRLVFTEGVLLSLVGGGIGIWLTLAAGNFVGRLGVPATRAMGQYFASTGIDVRVLVFATATTLLVALVAGLLPALRASSHDNASLRSGTRNGLSRQTRRLLGSVIIAEVGLAVILLSASVLVGRAYRSLATVELGYDPADRQVVQISLPATRFEPEERYPMLERFVERLTNEPGIMSAGYSHHLPVTGGDWTRAYSVENGETSGPNVRMLANVRWIGDSYVEAMGMAVARGRLFTRAEVEQNAPVVMISSQLATKHWPDDDPIGKRLKIGDAESENPWLEVIGVLVQVQEEWSFLETLYFPYTEVPRDQVELVVHASAAVPPTVIREAVREIDPGQPADEVLALDQLQAGTLQTDRMGALVISLFGAVGLAISLLGIYGVIAYSVRQRNREMGIRVALGSRPTNLVWLVTREGGRLVALGVTVGVAMSVLAIPRVSRALGAIGDDVEVQLFARGLDLNPLAVIAVSLVVFLAGVAAATIPARRVAADDPVRVLRAE